MQRQGTAGAKVQGTTNSVSNVHLSALALQAPTNNNDLHFLKRCADTLNMATPGSGQWYVQLGLATDAAIDLVRASLHGSGISTSVQHFRDDDLLEICV